MYVKKHIDLIFLAAASIGIVSAPFWASQATYVSRIATYHAHLKQKDVGHVVSLFFGIFFAIFGTCTVWGNLVAYFVLHQTNDPQRFKCGIHFNPRSENGTATSPQVSDLTVSNQPTSSVCSLIHSRNQHSVMFSVAYSWQWVLFR